MWCGVETCVGCNASGHAGSARTFGTPLRQISRLAYRRPIKLRARLAKPRPTEVDGSAFSNYKVFLSTGEPSP